MMRFWAMIPFLLIDGAAGAQGADGAQKLVEQWLATTKNAVVVRSNEGIRFMEVADGVPVVGQVLKDIGGGKVSFLICGESEPEERDQDDLRETNGRCANREPPDLLRPNMFVFVPSENGNYILSAASDVDEAIQIAEGIYSTSEAVEVSCSSMPKAAIGALTADNNTFWIAGKALDTGTEVVGDSKSEIRLSKIDATIPSFCSGAYRKPFAMWDYGKIEFDDFSKTLQAVVAQPLD